GRRRRGVAEPVRQRVSRARPGGRGRPALLLAFGGWNDAAEAATNAVRFLRCAWDGAPYATLDGEEFYHFGLSRPLVRFVPGTSDREIVWPDTEFSHCRPAGLARDALIGVGTKPPLPSRTSLPPV